MPRRRFSKPNRAPRRLAPVPGGGRERPAPDRRFEPHGPPGATDGFL